MCEYQLLLNDIFVQLDSNSFLMCYVQIFEQIKMDGWKFYNNIISLIWIWCNCMVVV